MTTDHQLSDYDTAGGLFMVGISERRVKEMIDNIEHEASGERIERNDAKRDCASAVKCPGL